MSPRSPRNNAARGARWAGWVPGYAADVVDDRSASLRTAAVTALLAQFADILGELYERGVVRTRNTPAGDLAELLVARAYNGRLAAPSGVGWDVWAGDGRRIEVACRVVQPGFRPSESYAPFRSWEFDACVFVQLDPASYAVRSAVELPVATVQAISAHSEWAAGHRVRVAQDLSVAEGARDVTARLRAALVELDRVRRPDPGLQEALPFDAVELTVVPPHPEVEPTGTCFCGCGEPTADGRHFLTSHDRKAEAAVIREHYGSIAAFVAAHRGVPPMT